LGNNIGRLLVGVGIIVSLMYILGTMSWAWLPSASAGTDFAAIIPGLLIVFLGMASMGEARGSAAVIGTGAFTGMGVALLLYELDAAGVLVAGSFGTWTLYNIQFGCVVLGLLLGAFLYYKNR